MNTKERAVMQQALEALEELFHSNSTKVAVEKYNIAHNALREALDHSGEANEMVVDWDRVKPEAIASDPLYQQGFVDGVEEGRNQVTEQAEQSQLTDATLEPVALPCCGYHDASAIMWNKFNGVVQCHNCGQIYAAPVRTKDLTDGEIADALYGKGCWRLGVHPVHLREYRRVIQADRELNK